MLLAATIRVFNIWQIIMAKTMGTSMETNMGISHITVITNIIKNDIIGKKDIITTITTIFMEATGSTTTVPGTRVLLSGTVIPDFIHTKRIKVIMAIISTTITKNRVKKTTITIEE